MNTKVVAWMQKAEFWKDTLMTKQDLLEHMRRSNTLRGEKLLGDKYYLFLGDPSPTVDAALVEELLDEGKIEISCQDEEYIFFRIIG